MAREIGSEFHRVAHDSGHGLIYPRHGTLVFSGRTAIESVLRYLPDVNTALLPSYCCDSMIAPFRVAGMDVSFYKVEWDEGLKIEVDGVADILLWCNYFGFKNEMPDFNGVIIEDITHSLFSERQYHSRSNFLVASLRKWEPVYCGGYCASVGEESLLAPDLKAPLKEFLELKASAMELKERYLEDGGEEKKPQFLSMFEKSNHWLSENYSGLSIDSWSLEYLRHVDMNKQQMIRRRNAKVLYRGLKKAQFLFPEEKMDCPLFVPILLEDRDKIREILKENKIYCPVHWEKPEGCESNIYEKELSLICDQRYDEADMERIVSVLNPLL